MYIEFRFLMVADIITIQRRIISHYIQHVLVPANIDNMEFVLGFLQSCLINERVDIFAGYVASQNSFVR